MEDHVSIRVDVRGVVTTSKPFDDGTRAIGGELILHIRPDLTSGEVKIIQFDIVLNH